MSDLDDKQAAQPMKLVGAGSDGAVTDFAQVDLVNGNRRLVARTSIVSEDATPHPVNVTNDGRLETEAIVADILPNDLDMVLDFVGVGTPPFVESSTVGPFVVGNTTLGIAVNGVAQSYLFPTTVATPGYVMSGVAPSVSNGGSVNIKVSVDGGTLTQIKIAKNLVGGSVIAAALQVQIRAVVPNGTNVVVDYGVTNLDRYTITSGTTGASSRVHTEVAGIDTLATLLKLTVATGDLEVIGLAANSYSADSVVVALLASLTDVRVLKVSSGKVHIETTAVGVGATLQVTAGGANTALGFPTTLVTGVAGTGSTAMNVNGSTTALRFQPIPPPGGIFMATCFVFRIRCAGATLKLFGSITELTNGIIVEFGSARFGINTFFTAKTNGELISASTDGQIILDSYNNNDDLVVARFTLCHGVRFSSSEDFVAVTVRDNLSSLVAFSIRARGIMK